MQIDMDIDFMEASYMLHVWHLTLEKDAAKQYFCHRSRSPHAVIVIVQEDHHVAVLNMDKQSGRVLAKHPRTCNVQKCKTCIHECLHVLQCGI